MSETQNADDNSEVTRPATLHKLDYDREREEAAKRLGVRVGALDQAVSDKRDEVPPPALIPPNLECTAEFIPERLPVGRLK